jgi:hypothetical protein
VDWRDRIVAHPDVLVGKAVIMGTRTAGHADRAGTRCAVQGQRTVSRRQLAAKLDVKPPVIAKLAALALCS